MGCTTPMYISYLFLFSSFNDKGVAEVKTQNELFDIFSPNISGISPFLPVLSLL